MYSFIKTANWINRVYRGEIESANTFSGELREEFIRQAKEKRDRMMNQIREYMGIA